MIQISLALVLALLVLGASRVLGFWAFLVLLGGVLAHLGDHLGTVVGKKRLSLFGIRPKHTAILVNFVTGALITLSALIGAVFISQDYREALLGVQKKKEEQELLTRQYAELQAKEHDLVGRLGDTEGKLRKTEEDLKQADATREALAQDVLRLREEGDRRKQLLEESKKLLAAKETKQVAFTKGMPLLRRPLLVDLDVTRAELRDKLLAMLDELHETVAAAGLQARVPDQNRVAELVDRFDAGIKEVREFVQTKAKEDPSFIPPKQLYIRPIARKNINVSEELTSVHIEALRNQVIFKKGEEIAHTQLDGRKSEEQLMQQLFNFDARAQEEMLRRGVLEEALMDRRGRISAPLLLRFTQIVQKAREADRWISVRMVADAHIYAYGDIKVSYRQGDATSGSNGGSGSGSGNGAGAIAPTTSARIPGP